MRTASQRTQRPEHSPISALCSARARPPGKPPARSLGTGRQLPPTPAARQRQEKLLGAGPAERSPIQPSGRARVFRPPQTPSPPAGPEAGPPAGPPLTCPGLPSCAAEDARCRRWKWAGGGKRTCPSAPGTHLAPGDEPVVGGLAHQRPQLAEEGWDPRAGGGRWLGLERLRLLLLLHCRPGASTVWPGVGRGGRRTEPGLAPAPPDRACAAPAPRLRTALRACARARHAPAPRALRNVPTCAALTCHNSARPWRGRSRRARPARAWEAGANEGAALPQGRGQALPQGRGQAEQKGTL